MVRPVSAERVLSSNRAHPDESASPSYLLRCEANEESDDRQNRWSRGVLAMPRPYRLAFPREKLTSHVVHLRDNNDSTVVKDPEK